MRKEGLYRKRYILDQNKWEDLHIFALTCEDLGFSWEKIKPKSQTKKVKR